MSRKVSLSVEIPPEHIGALATVYDVLGRAAAGLLMEGIESSIYTFVSDEEEAQG